MYFCEGRKLHNIFSHETHTRIMGVMLSHEMWPTVTYCCMSSLHRKGVNERHSLIMKIVCIFLNWESSLRLHRAVLLHITREGKKNTDFFFCSKNNLLSATTIDLHGRCLRKERRQQMERLEETFLCQEPSFQQLFSAMAANPQLGVIFFLPAKLPFLSGIWSRPYPPSTPRISWKGRKRKKREKN